MGISLRAGRGLGPCAHARGAGAQGGGGGLGLAVLVVGGGLDGQVEGEGDHDIWPWVRYFVSVLAQAYEDFERLAVASSSLDGLNKQAQVEKWATEQAGDEFTRAEIEAALPWVSSGTITIALNRLRDEGQLTVSRGRAAT